MKAQIYDIAVVGAGIVGTTLAALLKRSSLSVALFDSQPALNPSSGEFSTTPAAKHYQLRISAISPGSRQLLESCGAWEYIDHGRVCAYDAMYVWDAGSSGDIRFDAAEIARPNLGYIVENMQVQQALLKAIAGCDNISCHWGTDLIDLRVLPKVAEIQLDSSQTIRAKLIVGADGGRSWVRKHLDIGQSVRDYQQIAIVCEVETQHSHCSTAWQRFLSTGPVAFLPLANGHCSIVWSCENQDAEKLMQQSDQVFATSLEQAFESKLGAVRLVSERNTFPLNNLIASRYIADRAALIGDAAHVVHPLAGQGVNLGLQDAASLAGIIEQIDKRQCDIGAVHYLRRYERERRSETELMNRSLNLLFDLFRSEYEPVKKLRGLGLKVTDKLDSLKYLLARQALGDSVHGTQKPIL